MIIDFHAHIGESRIFARNSGSARSLVEMMDRNKIEKAVLIPTATPPRPRYYEDVLNALKEYPDRFYGFFLANPRDQNVCSLLDMVVNKYGFIGVKLHPTFLGFPADDRTLVYPIMEKAKELKILVIFHSDPTVYATPWQVGLVALDFPEVTIVMAHMGFLAIVYNDAAIQMAKKAPNLYLDTTGVYSTEKIAQAVRELGATRVIYGSDMPFHDPAFEMSKIGYVKISEEDKKLVWGGNAKRLLDPFSQK